jgi:hypothetical protein
MAGLIDELGTYARELDENGQATEKIKNKNDFHRLDGLRYLICGLSKSGGSYGDSPFGEYRG